MSERSDKIKTYHYIADVQRHVYENSIMILLKETAEEIQPLQMNTQSYHICEFAK